MARSGAAQDLFAALARGSEAGGVDLGARVAGQADQGDLVQRPVGLSVAAAVESVAVGPPGAGGDRGGAAQGGEGCLGADSVGVVAGGDEQGGGGDDAVALGGEHRRGGAGGQCAQLGVDVGDLVGQDPVAAGQAAQCPRGRRCGGVGGRCGARAGQGADEPPRR